MKSLVCCVCLILLSSVNSGVSEKNSWDEVEEKLFILSECSETNFTERHSDRLIADESPRQNREWRPRDNKSISLSSVDPLHLRIICFPLRWEYHFESIHIDCRTLHKRIYAIWNRIRVESSAFATYQNECVHKNRASWLQFYLIEQCKYLGAKMFNLKSMETLSGHCFDQTAVSHPLQP